MCDLEYEFNYKPPEINIVNMLTVFVYTLLYFLTFNAEHIFYNHKAYSENVSHWTNREAQQCASHFKLSSQVELCSPLLVGPQSYILVFC